MLGAATHLYHGYLTGGHGSPLHRAEPSVGEKHYISVVIAAVLVDNGNTSD